VDIESRAWPREGGTAGMIERPGASKRVGRWDFSIERQRRPGLELSTTRTKKKPGIAPGFKLRWISLVEQATSASSASGCRDARSLALGGGDLALGRLGGEGSGILHVLADESFRKLALRLGAALVVEIGIRRADRGVELRVEPCGGIASRSEAIAIGRREGDSFGAVDREGR